MKLLVQANLLAVGLGDKTNILSRLPICLFSAESAAEAISLLRNEKINGVFSKWNLDDMPEGLFLRKLKMVKPNLATIAMVNGPVDEIQARSMGVTAVITEQCSDEFLLAAVSQILGLEIPSKVTHTVKVNAHVRG